jgi:hypothetical protein
MANPDMYHDALLCIECQSGIMEDLPASYYIDDETGRATLVTFKIGAWEGDREAAVQMTGEAHVAMQERMAADQWAEDAEDRELSRGDYLRDLRDDR